MAPKRPADNPYRESERSSKTVKYEQKYLDNVVIFLELTPLN